MYGYIIPEEFNNYMTTKKYLTPKKIIINMDVEKSAEELVDMDESGGVSINTQNYLPMNTI